MLSFAARQSSGASQEGAAIRVVLEDNLSPQLYSGRNFCNRAPQFVREQTKPIAAAVAIAGFARLFQTMRGGAKSGGTDCLRCAFEAVRGRREGGEIGGAPSCGDRSLGVDCAGAELL